MSASATVARILVIEDHKHVSMLIEKVLARAGHHVTLAATGKEGLEKIAAGSFELVVIDKNLPDVDGIRLLRSIRSTHPHVRAIVITGDPNTQSRVAAQGLGALDYLSKPFELDLLLKSCTAALSVPVPVAGRPLRRVLVVDDDDSVAKLSREVLSRAGYEVELARTSGAAIAALERQHFDLLLIDRFLPGSDGLDLGKLARKKLPNVAIIMMTAGEAPSSELRAEMDGFLPKPFANLRSLVDELKKALEAKGLPGGSA